MWEKERQRDERQRARIERGAHTAETAREGRRREREKEGG